jgi:hypothetical protein
MTAVLSVLLILGVITLVYCIREILRDAAAKLDRIIAEERERTERGDQ